LLCSGSGHQRREKKLAEKRTMDGENFEPSRKKSMATMTTKRQPGPKGYMWSGTGKKRAVFKMSQGKKTPVGGGPTDTHGWGGNWQPDGTEKNRLNPRGETKITRASGGAH